MNAGDQRSIPSREKASRKSLGPPPRRMTVALFVGLATAASSLSCQSKRTCSGGLSIDIDVTVVDAATGTQICGATVSASDGSSTYPADRSPKFDAVATDASCTYFINPHRSGRYTVTGSALGYRDTQVSDVTLNVQNDECGESAQTQFVTLKLVPMP